MNDTKNKLEIPKFPENDIGLVRGSVIEALTNKASYIAKKGTTFPVGFDGEYIRCGPSITWDIKSLEKEINAGFWKIVDEVDLSNKEISQHFAKTVEMLE